MKKFLMIALLVGAIPAVAFGQAVTCDACSHDVSVYMGSGGFIAETDAEEVVWVSECDGVTVSGELEPNADGVVAMLFSEDNGLACDDEDGRLQLGPVMDGGWYWITDDMNSAVGNLVAQVVLDNETTDITNAGTGVTMEMGKGAVYLKETSTGRVGILPNILPMPEMDPVAVNTCSFTGTGATAAAETSNCMLGNGGSTLQVKGPTNIFTGKRPDLGANAMVTRPASGSVDVTADLWGNGTGHYTAGTVDNAGTTPANLGHAGGTRLAATIAASLASTGPGDGENIDGTGPGSAEGAGLTFAFADGLGTLTVVPDMDYCNPTAKPPVNHTATVTVTASLDATQKTQVVPTLTTTPADAGVAARHTIMIVCPSASANMGTELVPENPFPTDK